MREIVLDTETTGLDPGQGDRIVEIGCIELINTVRTNGPGSTFHVYINPERPMSAEAAAVHGLTDDFLTDKPVFADIIDAFIDFIGDSRFVIHNAAFDMKFLNAEFRWLGRPAFPADRAVDTLAIARHRYPGAQASLDALCRRFGIDASDRVLHGALLDAELLAEVYLELCGGRQPGLSLVEARAESATSLARPRVPRPARPHAPTAEELTAHKALVDRLKTPIWRQT